MMHCWKSRPRGFTLIETLTAIALLGILTAGVVIAVQAQWSSVDSAWGPKRAESLNLAMNSYRALIRRGYSPQTSWSASNAAGVLAELAKPLQREGVTIIVMATAPQFDLSVGNLSPSDFTSNAIWTSTP